jgi:hypothetical protein
MALNLLDFLTPVARDALVLVVDSMKCAVSRSGVSGAGAVFRVAEGGGLVCGIQFISPSQQSRYIAVGLSLKFKSATHMHVQVICPFARQTTRFSNCSSDTQNTVHT